MTEPISDDTAVVDLDDIAEDAAPIERPEDLPTLMPVGLLNKDRAKRALFWEHAGSDAIAALADSDGDLDMGAAKHAYRALADMELALKVVVIPAARKQMDEWLREVDDETLIEAYSWYMQALQPGEASSSPS